MSELKAISEVLNFSLDEIMAQEFNLEIQSLESNFQGGKLEVRISVPEINLLKFQNLVLYILEKCGGKPNIGETVLYKLLYFSDFNYYELYEEHLSGAIYRRLPNGPVPLKVDVILKNMIDEKQLKPFKTKYFGYLQNRYMPLVNANLKLFNGAEIDTIDKVIDLLSDMSASEISRYSHEDMPWKASNDMDIIDYELVFYRQAPYSVRTYNDPEGND
ncbi:MAG: Panacea domain-containing protein [Bacteroidales bacterium]|nr:Panacea domain-containing protein [Bacteroidales bacterium]